MTLIWVEPTSFLDHDILGFTQRECQISKDIVGNYRSMFESMISAGAMGKLPETQVTGKPDAETLSLCSCDMEGHAKKCVGRYCEVTNKQRKQFYKVATPCLDTINLEKKKMEQL